MRIAIDARAWGWTGVGRYIRNLIGSLVAVDTTTEYIVMLPEAQLPSFNRLAATWKRKPQVVIVDGSYYSWREQTIFWRQAEAIQADLFHFTHFNVPLLFSKPYVVTIHDTTRFFFPGQKQTGVFQQLAYEMILSRAVAGARAVICMSETTAADLASLPLRLPKNVTTIYQGVDEAFFQPISSLSQQKIRMLIDTPKPYLLSVGVWMNHKNINRLLDAFALVKKSFPDIRLVVTGRPKPGYINVVRLAQEKGLEGSVIFPGFVPHVLLPALYQQASLFIFPSLYEGFGLPPLEAGACGTPVVAAGVASIPEVMGPAALYINPEDTANIAHEIREVLTNPVLRQQLVIKGQERAQLYRWTTSAQQHKSVYESLQNG